MKYIDTAFGQLQFAIKLMQAAEDGSLDIDAIDRPLTLHEGPSVFVLHDRVLDSPNDLVLACQNLVTVSFGAAAITLNRCREEAGIELPSPIMTEADCWIALVYQIRNAFAHDIAEPRWAINDRYRREYIVERVRADLRGLDGALFEYSAVGGIDGFFSLKAWGDNHAFGREP